MLGILVGFMVNFLCGAPPQSSTSLHEPLVWFMIYIYIYIYIYLKVLQCRDAELCKYTVYQIILKIKDLKFTELKIYDSIYYIAKGLLEYIIKICI